MGTRRKARECALQMLFAADVAQIKGSILAKTYWSEFGIEELYRGANALINSFLNELEETEKAVNDKVIKKISNSVSKNYSRNITDINFQIEDIKNKYKEFVNNLVVNNSTNFTNIYSAIEELQKLLDYFFYNLKEQINKNPKLFSSDDENQFRAITEQSEQKILNLQNSILPEIEKMLKEIEKPRLFTDNISLGALRQLDAIDDKIRTRAEHWRIERMAIVDRNVLRLAVYEFLFTDTPHTVVINEALEIARRFSSYEATQFINGILDAIKHDLEKTNGGDGGKKKATSSS